MPMARLLYRGLHQCLRGGRGVRFPEESIIVHESPAFRRLSGTSVNARSIARLNRNSAPGMVTKRVCCKYQSCGVQLYLHGSSFETVLCGHGRRRNVAGEFEESRIIG